MGMERFELSTHRLKADYSTAELHTRKQKPRNNCCEVLINSYEYEITQQPRLVVSSVSFVYLH